jgi:hypothetical protein
VGTGQIAEKKSVRESFGEADAMLSKLEFEPDVDPEEKKKERQGAEPSPHVENRNVGSAAESGSLANQNLTDKKTAQDEKQLDAMKTAVAEDSKSADQMRIEHNKPVRADYAHDRRRSEEIEAEDPIGRGLPGTGWDPADMSLR